MARRKADPVLQKLRRLARSGRRREAAAMLEETIQRNPGHTRAREELARFLRGKPFSFEEREYAELQTIIADFQSSPQELARMNRAALKKLRHRALIQEKALDHLVSLSERKSLGQLRAAITRELQRRQRPLARISLLITAALAFLAAVGGGSCILWQRAENAADTLDAAAGKNFQRSRAIELLKIHDTGLNRTLNRRVSESAGQLRLLIQRSEQNAHELDSILRKIESGKQSVVSLGVYQRVLIERRLTQLGRDAGTLHARWAELCRKEQKELNQQRLSLVEELMAPLPEWQGVQGSPETDIPLLQARMKTLQQRISIYEDAAAALELPESTISAARKEMESCRHLLAEINAFRLMLQTLPEAQHYDRYRQLLHDFSPEHYLPAIELMSVLRHIPSVASLRGLMQERGQDLPGGVIQRARGGLIDGQPSFSADFPATAEQLHLLDELLTNSALFTRLYELTNTAEGLQAYSEKLPQLKYGRACFNRSALDPERNVAENKYVEWQNPNSVVSRTLDPRPLCQAIGLDDRTGFVSKMNLPETLTRLLQHEHAEVPPLAKAYIFHHLVQVNGKFSPALLSGLRFAPEMRSVIESFEKLRGECQVRLDGNCWLRRTPAHAEAEAKYARWFRKHRKVDFAAELKENLRPLLRVTPRFCGYINEDGVAVLHEPARENQLIWYLSDGAMTATAWGKPLQRPMKLSPVFTMEN